MCVVFGNSDDGGGHIKESLEKELKKYWDLGETFTQDQLEHYKSLHKRARQKLGPLSEDFGDKKPARAILNTPILTKSWDQFYDEVCNEEYHSVDERIKLLATIRHWFEEFQHFHDMPSKVQRVVAGIGGSDEVPKHWGWFGSMFGAGRFKNRVRENDINLSRALDAIPLEGEVREEHYSRFIDSYRKAFSKDLGHGLGTATRLLAMKRPDYFVCLDNANREELCKAFEITLGNHAYDRYWNSIVERIILAQWWNSPRPTDGRAMKVWDGRAAFLDSLYYVEQ